MGQCFLTLNTMKIFVFLSILSLASTAPAPQEDAAPVADSEVVPYIHEEIEAVPYEHDPTGDVAETYVHEEIDALPYVHEEIDALQYVHEEPEPAPLVVSPAVVSYGFAPVAPVAVTNYAALPKVAAGVKDGVKLALISPVQLLAGYKTGCVNSVGSVVPCLV